MKYENQRASILYFLILQITCFLQDQKFRKMVTFRSRILLILFIVKWLEYLRVQIIFYSYIHKIGQKLCLSLRVSVSNCWVGQSQPKLFGRKSIICRYNIPVSWFHKAALSAPKETIRSARWGALYQQLPVRGRKE